MSSSSSTSKKTTKGFSEKDVNSFLQRGANLASKSSRQEAIDPLTKQTRTETTRRKDGATSVTESGFMGKFSTMSMEQIEAIGATFQQREKSIAQRRAQPGRASLFMGRA